MAEVIPLPSAASAPVSNKRQRGSYGRKVISVRGQAAYRASVRLGRHGRDQTDTALAEADRQELMAVLRELGEQVSTGAITNLAFVMELRGEVVAGAVGPIKVDAKVKMVGSLMKRLAEYGH